MALCSQYRDWLRSEVLYLNQTNPSVLLKGWERVCWLALPSCTQIRRLWAGAQQLLVALRAALTSCCVRAEVKRKLSASVPFLVGKEKLFDS